jgi:hypothetical protein
MKLHDDDVRRYRDQGIALVADFVAPAWIETFRREADRITAGATAARHDPARVEMEPNQPADGNKIRRIYEPCEYYPPFREFAESAVILDAIEQLIGPNLLLHYSKLNMKPAELGSVVEWHQDMSYYPLSNHDSLAVLIYLDDADEENGCLKVLPAYHRADLLDHTASGVFQGRITEEVDESAAIDLPGKAGSAIFLHGMTPHASVQNRSGKPRRTLIISYRAADAFPIFIDNRTLATEEFTRLVRGERAHVARFTFTRFPVPLYGEKEASLYDLQERSRANAV